MERRRSNTETPDEELQKYRNHAQIAIRALRDITKEVHARHRMVKIAIDALAEIERLDKLGVDEKPELIVVQTILCSKKGTIVQENRVAMNRKKATALYNLMIQSVHPMKSNLAYVCVRSYYCATHIDGELLLGIPLTIISEETFKNE